MRKLTIPHFHTLFFQGVGKVWKVGVKYHKNTIPPHLHSICRGWCGCGLDEGVVWFKVWRNWA